MSMFIMKPWYGGATETKQTTTFATTTQAFNFANTNWEATRLLAEYNTNSIRSVSGVAYSYTITLPLMRYNTTGSTFQLHSSTALTPVLTSTSSSRSTKSSTSGTTTSVTYVTCVDNNVWESISSEKYVPLFVSLSVTSPATNSSFSFYSYYSNMSLSNLTQFPTRAHSYFSQKRTSGYSRGGRFMGAFIKASDPSKVMMLVGDDTSGASIFSCALSEV